MVITRYISGVEIPQSDLHNIIITRNDDIRAIIDRVIVRINDTNAQPISTDNIPK